MTAARRRAGILFPLVALIAGTALLRFVLAERIPIVDDEAYYWLWSRHLGWGYPDHPPMIAALIALATPLIGDSPVAIRALPVLLASGIPLLTYAAGRDLFDAPSGLRAACIVSLMPIAALGTALAFPDAPFGFFWVLGLWTGWRALQNGGWWWVATGAAAGLALLTKLTGLFFLLGFAGILAAGAWRRALRDPWFYTGAGIATFLAAPFIYWNALSGWSTIRFTLARPPWIAPRSVPENLLLFMVGQLAYHGVIALSLAGAVVAAARRAGPVWRYLVWMSAPLALAVFVSAAWARPKPHWPTPAYFAAAIAFGALWPTLKRTRLRLHGAAVAATAVLTLSLAAAALLPIGLDLNSSLGRWEGVAHAAARRAEERRKVGRHVFILADGYQAASRIAYVLRERIPVTPLRDAFMLWLPPHNLDGHDIVYVDTGGEQRAQGRAHLRLRCFTVTRAETVTISPWLTATLYLCEAFGEFPPFYSEWRY